MRKKNRLGADAPQRFIQAASLGLFFWLLWNTVSPPPGAGLPVDLFLRLDPLVAAAVPLAARHWIAALAPGFAVLALTLVLGRVFCGYICPLGATLDAARLTGKALAGKRPPGKRPAAGKDRDAPAPPHRLRSAKYLILAGVLGAAALGVNFAFWVSPIPLITRFYALLLHALLTLAGSEGLALGRDIFGSLPGLEYAEIAARRYSTLYFLAFFFGALLCLERVRPRFWCRYLCPAGALLGLLSPRPFWRRRVSACNGCGLCARRCPTGAIAPENAARTAHAECIACRTCTGVCPEQGVAFGFGIHADPAPDPAPEAAGRGKPRARDTASAGELPAVLPTRRAFLAAAAGGAALAATGFSGTGSLLSAVSKGSLLSPACIRPPGALPEPDFLDRCVRCGQCMKVCPTNALQPTWFDAGPEGVFSPIMVSRRGACDPDCNACGGVCPTGAIHNLPLEEKTWAKVGTAVVREELCLAWAEGRRCVVCEEVCPYGAIKNLQRPGHGVAVPVVEAARCFGCGYCEHFCPVRIPAIVVHPLNAQRLAHTDFRRTGQEAGLTLLPTGKQGELPDASPVQLEEGALPPGFLE